MKPRAERTAVEIDGLVTVHAKFVGPGRDTLCGLVGRRAVPVPRNGRARIDCVICAGIWGAAFRYKRNDFTERAAQKL